MRAVVDGLGDRHGLTHETHETRPIRAPTGAPDRSARCLFVSRVNGPRAPRRGSPGVRRGRRGAVHGRPPASPDVAVPRLRPVRDRGHRPRRLRPAVHGAARDHVPHRPRLRQHDDHPAVPRDADLAGRVEAPELDHQAGVDRSRFTSTLGLVSGSTQRKVGLPPVSDRSAHRHPAGRASVTAGGRRAHNRWS
jgi:hypothetical protein